MGLNLGDGILYSSSIFFYLLSLNFINLSSSLSVFLEIFAEFPSIYGVNVQCSILSISYKLGFIMCFLASYTFEAKSLLVFVLGL